ncbi:MAG TPA: 3-isopropylmalate dehydratase large subunit [Myxococcaceae bacterium]|nr:3-isopropylmalate dehydratase large subunit [Myxococcaceae bacterium]
MAPSELPARTLFDRIWQEHLVRPETEETPAVVFVDLHLVHEVTSPQAFTMLRERGLRVRRPDLTLATMDHSTPTTPAGPAGEMEITDVECRVQLDALEQNCRDFRIELHPLGTEHQGIVHVIGPELGLTQPGRTIVCGDSHTSTHGAFGAFAFGIGTSEVAHVLATQCLLQRRPRSLEVRVNGRLGPCVTAKDLVLAIIARLGVSGGTGHVLEYSGEAIRSLSMEARMTLCNMSIEAGARAGLIAPDDTTFEYLHGRPRAPRGRAWDAALERWRALRTEPGARFDASVEIDASALEPTITFGTNPGMSAPVSGRVPDPEREREPAARRALEAALRYMGLRPGQPLQGHPIDVVFIGSCTNGRLSDLRAAASVLQGRKVAPGVRVLVVPGSRQVKRAAEDEGLHRLFLEAGAEWREPGCSMCIGMNGDQVPPGRSAVSTSNRNFEGRQGPGARTFLASPLTAAAAAVTGALADPRMLVDAGLQRSA